MNANSLTTHFATVEKLIKEHGIYVARMFNLDEVGASPGRGADGKLACRRLMPRRGVQDFISCDFSYENRLTMMHVINAEGDCGPPLFVMKGKRVPFREVLRNGNLFPETPLSLLPRHSVLAPRAEGGGVDRENFLSWAWKFVNYTKDLRADGRKVLLIYDAYISHISLEVLGIFMENVVVVYALPAHTSGKTQPLDVVLFAAFKQALNKAVSNCSGFDDGRKLNLVDLCSVMRHAFDDSFTRSNVMAGFRRAGLWPLNSTPLLNITRPASAAPGAPIMSVEELEKAYEAKRLELRNGRLRDNAQMLDCGYVDTQNGCVMTFATVLNIMRKKQCEQQKKKEVERKKALEKEIKAAQRRTKVLVELQRMREAQCRRRAWMAKMTVEEYSAGVRSIKERRAAPKMRELNKRT